jgi:hypothetical protein
MSDSPEVFQALGDFAEANILLPQKRNLQKGICGRFPLK